MRLRARIDRNQPEIVDTFRKLGYSVLHLHQIGKGCPDLLVAKDGVSTLIEVKDGNKPPSARKLTADEAEFHSTWRGSLAIVNSVEDVLEAFGGHVSVSHWGLHEVGE